MAEQSNRFVDRFESRISLWAVIGGPALVAVVTAYLASMSDWINQFGAVAWVIAGLLAGLLVLLIALTILEIQLMHFRSSAIKRWQAKSDYINPLDNAFEGKRINFSDLSDPVTREIKGKTFTECELNGPAVVVIAGDCIYDDVQFANCDVIVLRKGSLPIYTGIFLRDSQFIRSRIANTTILVGASSVESIINLGVTPISYYPIRESDSTM
jgi:uncharacterized membrane protein